MALTDLTAPVYKTARGMTKAADGVPAAGKEFELAIPQFTGIVHGTIARRSVMTPWIPVQQVRGTNVVTNYGIGPAELGKVTPGKVPDGQASLQDQINLTIDTLVYARHFQPLIDSFVENYNIKQKLGEEQGKTIAKFYDQAFLIQAVKAGLMATSGYKNLNGKGFSGGNKVTMASALDRKDPAKLEKAIIDMLVGFEKRDIDPRMDDFMIVLTPEDYYTLLQAEKFININYLTSAGTQIDGQMALKAYGVPVINSNNLPQTDITTHLLGDAYKVDASKVIASVLSPKALLAGELIPLQSDVFYDKLSKQWVIDSHLSFGITADRADYAGVIVAGD